MFIHKNRWVLTQNLMFVFLSEKNCGLIWKIMSWFWFNNLRVVLYDFKIMTRFLDQDVVHYYVLASLWRDLTKSWHDFICIWTLYNHFLTYLLSELENRNQRRELRNQRLKIFEWDSKCLNVNLWEPKEKALEIGLVHFGEGNGW